MTKPTLKEMLATVELVEPDKDLHNSIYRADKLNGWGVSSYDELVSGLTLVCVFEGNCYDPLHDYIRDLGNEFNCVLPGEGLIEGAFYETENSYAGGDYFSGDCDGTDLKIVRIL